MSRPRLRVADGGAGNALLDLGGGHLVQIANMAPSAITADMFLLL